MTSRVGQASILSLLWFCSLGALGIWMPYYSLYLRENASLSEGQVGLVLAVVPLVSLAANPIWGWLSDRTGRRGGVLFILCGGSAIGFLTIWRLDGFFALMLGTASVALFFRSLTPMLNGVSLAVAKEAGRQAFSVSRSFGTAGFLVMAVTLPWIMQALPPTTESGTAGSTHPGLGVIFPWMAFLISAAAAAALLLPLSSSLQTRMMAGEAKDLLRRPAVIRLVIYLFAFNFLVRGPINFLPLLVRARGGGVDDIAQMWLLMLIIEIPLIAFSGPIISRLGPGRIMKLAVLSEAVRWTLSGAAPGLHWLLAAQALHGIGVVGQHVAAPLYLDSVVPARMRSSAQGLASMAGFGAGAIASNAAIGVLFEDAGANAACLAIGLSAFAFSALTLRILQSPSVRKE